jgi:hypothetical protein
MRSSHWSSKKLYVKSVFIVFVSSVFSSTSATSPSFFLFTLGRLVSGLRVFEVSCKRQNKSIDRSNNYEKGSRTRSCVLLNYLIFWLLLKTYLTLPDEMETTFVCCTPTSAHDGGGPNMTSHIIFLSAFASKFDRNEQCTPFLLASYL